MTARPYLIACPVCDRRWDLTLEGAAEEYYHHDCNGEEE